MSTLPTNEDIRKAREQANQALEGAVEQARTPLMAALGAGDIAAHAVVGTVQKVRHQLTQSAETARDGVTDLPGDLNDLRGRLRADELRKLVDSYSESAVQLYGYFAERGENAFGRFRTQPHVQQAWTQVGTAQQRMEEAVDNARDFADDTLGRVTTTTRSFGERAARGTQQAAEETAQNVRETGENISEATRETAETVQHSGDQAAAGTRSAARKAANRTAATKSTAADQRNNAGQRNNTGQRNGTGGHKSGAKTNTTKQPKPATRKTAES